MAIKTGSLEDIAAPGALNITDREFRMLRALVYKQTGITLGDNKSTMLSGRLNKRVRQLNLPSFEAYYHLVQQQGKDSDELRQLINSVTTNKTAFFREKHHFEFLNAQLKQHPGNAPLRIWSAACSSGEEPYSIAMTVADALPAWHGMNIRILASDIDTKVLSDAEFGFYKYDTLADIPGPFHKRFLRPQDHEGQSGFRIQKELRELVTFRQKNLVADSWSINATFDFIFCRNVLIYFDRETQDKILRKFISYLKPNAYLIIGHSEHVHWLSGLLEPMGYTIYRARKWRIAMIIRYRKHTPRT